MYLLTSFDTDTNKRLGTPGTGNKWGRGQMSTQTSRDKWGQANEGERVDECKQAGDKREQSAMRANEGQTSATG